MEFAIQVKTFLVIGATGILLGVLFDIYRVLRLRFRPHWLVTTAADLLYCLLASAVAFAALLISNWGEFRFYVVIALVSGVVFYYRLVSRYVMKFIVVFFKFMAGIVRTGRKIVDLVIVRPLFIIIRTIVWPAHFVGRKYNNWWKKRHPPPAPPEQPPPG
ncbi:MAG: yabQ [Firmicutes bacterium]|nr:yabQ [Bacillota bacterium]